MIIDVSSCLRHDLIVGKHFNPEVGYSSRVLNLEHRKLLHDPHVQAHLLNLELRNYPLSDVHRQ
jgi:hypothetical protein